MGTNYSFQSASRMLAGIFASLLLGGTPLIATAQTVPLRVAATPGIDVAPVFAGIDKGIFLKHQLDVKLDLFPTGVEAINSVVGGTTDIAAVGIYPFLSAVSKGLPLTMISHSHGDALASSLNDLISLVASKSSGIKAGNLASIKGKKIGVPFGSGAHNYIIALIQQAGFKESDVEMINVQAPNLATALANGDLDAMAVFEPWASNAVAKVPGAVRVMHGGAEGFYNPGVLAVLAKARDAKPELLTRFLTAYAEAQQWVRKNQAETAKISMRWIPGVDLDVLTAAIPLVSQDMRLSKNTIDSFRNMSIPLMVKRGIIKESFDPAKFVDPTLYVVVNKKTPQYFSDLKAIPKDRLIQQ